MSTGAATTDPAPNRPIARLIATALDCPDPAALAEFYRSILGGDITVHGDDWVQLTIGTAIVAFQLDPDHRRPTWPEGDVPQQAHLDLGVPDLDDGEAAIVALGATKADVQPVPDEFRVFFDPAGHPFCLVHQPTP